MNTYMLRIHIYTETETIYFLQNIQQLLSSAAFMKDTRSQFILALFFTSYIMDFHLQAIIQLSA